jgi:hypothetical protein
VDGFDSTDHLRANSHDRPNRSPITFKLYVVSLLLKTSFAAAYFWRVDTAQIMAFFHNWILTRSRYATAVDQQLF